MRLTALFKMSSLATVLFCLGVSGCGSTVGFAADPASTTATGNFKNPLDTVPTSNGQVFYFTASSMDGKPTVYRVLASGGAVDTIASGAPLVAPNGITISSDDLTLYIADTSAGLFKLSLPTGTPQLIPGTANSHPRGLDVAQVSGADVLYFTGDDTASGQGGVFSIPAAGGTIATIAKGAPLVTPVGIVVGPTGTIYVSNPVPVWDVFSSAAGGLMKAPPTRQLRSIST